MQFGVGSVGATINLETIPNNCQASRNHRSHGLFSSFFLDSINLSSALGCSFSDPKWIKQGQVREEASRQIIEGGCDGRLAYLKKKRKM